MNHRQPGPAQELRCEFEQVAPAERRSIKTRVSRAMTSHRVFVYGSLRRGNAGAMSVKFPDAKYVGDGNVRGSLYDLGAYPGLLLDDSGSPVVGEVYEVNEQTLSQLDQFELSSDYRRKEVEVEHDKGRSRCWIYVPELNAEFFPGRPLVESGDWLQHLRSRG